MPDLTSHIAVAVAQLADAGMTLPRRDPETITVDALDILKKRDLVRVDGDQVTVQPGATDVLAFYANSIAHHFDAATAKQ